MRALESSLKVISDLLPFHSNKSCSFVEGNETGCEVGQRRSWTLIRESDLLFMCLCHGVLLGGKREGSRLPSSEALGILGWFLLVPLAPVQTGLHVHRNGDRVRLDTSATDGDGDFHALK